MSKDNNDSDFWILPLPCGCAVEADTFKIYFMRGGDICECPWCQTTFREREFDAWLNGGGPVPVFLEHPVRAILRDGERLLEPTGRCGGCGIPTARERGTVKEFHLDETSFKRLVLLEN